MFRSSSVKEPKISDAQVEFNETTTGHILLKDFTQKAYTSYKAIKSIRSINERKCMVI